MALLRNYGYVARRVDVSDKGGAVIEVIDDADHAVVTITVSTDGLDWVITGRRNERVLRPLSTPLSELAETIVGELDRPN
ncbi:hypothetical protein [Mycobacterium sp.]|uniref:hypothetical protein n=1 Tax=Mycobacterium sp. TaxID=1785 RepID=UPI002D95FFCC|nr:hypothetical protein [Mycobacterium sp.]